MENLESCVKASTKQVQKELEHFEGEVNFLLKTADDLENVLSSVLLSSALPMTAKEPEQEEIVPLADIIRHGVAKIRVCNSNLENIIDRLQI